MQDETNENNEDSRPDSESNIEPGVYAIVTQRKEKYIRAYALLQKTFGSYDFSDSAAARVGVDTHVLSDLVKFKCVRFSDRRYDLHIPHGNFSGSYETPLHFFRVDTDSIQKHQHASFEQPVESKVHKESVERFFGDLDSTPSSSRSDVDEPMLIFKRFRCTGR